MAQHGDAKVARIMLSAARAQERIHRLAKDSANVILSGHAEERMLERGFIDVDVYRILRTGTVEEDPIDDDGEWCCKVIKRMAVGRDAGVVTIIMSSGKLFVKTVEWEDGR